MRSEIDSVRLILQPIQREAIGVRAEAVPVGAGSDQEVQDTVRAAPGLERGDDLARVTALDRSAGGPDLAADKRADDRVVDRVRVAIRTLAGDDAGEPQEDLGLLDEPLVALEDGGRVVRHVAGGELVSNATERRTT